MIKEIIISVARNILHTYQLMEAQPTGGEIYYEIFIHKKS